MALRGSTGSIDLANVFQMLTLSQKVGTLIVYSRGHRTSLFMSGRGVLFPYDRDAFTDKVLRVLLRRGWIHSSHVEEARLLQEAWNTDLFTTMIRMQRIQAAEVRKAFLEQMEEEIYDLFFDPDATFEFHEGPTPEVDGRVIDEDLLLSPNGLIMEAAKRVDEWGHIHSFVPSDSCVFEAAADLSEIDGADSTTTEVFAVIDGVCNVSSIVERTRLSRYQVFKCLLRLSEARILYEVPLEVLLERAEQCLQSQRFGDGLALLERAFELGADQPLAHEMAALACQAIHRLGRACHHYEKVARSLEAKGDHRAAAEIYLRIREMIPTSVTARKELLDFYLKDPEFFRQSGYDVLQEASDLAAILHALGHETEASATLLKVYQRLGDNSKAAVQLAQLAIDMSDPKSAVTILMSCADSCLEKRDLTQALRVYRRVRSIDPAHSGLDAKIQACQETLEKTQPKPRKFLRTAALLIVVGGACTMYFNYNRSAAALLLEFKAEELALDGEFEGAAMLLQRFSDEHQGTMAALVAGRMAADMKERAAAHQLFISEIDQRDVSDRLKRQEQAERLAEEGIRQFKLGNYEPALEQLKRAKTFSGNEAWLESQEIPRIIEEIDSYLASCAALQQKLKTARHEERWPEAHALVLDLLQRFPRSPIARDVLLPVRFDSDPSGAELSLRWNQEGKELALVGKTPCVLDLPPVPEVEATVSLEGYAPTTSTLKVQRSPNFELRLDRVPPKSFVFPRPPLFEPVAAGDLLVAGCQAGRLVAASVFSGEMRWEETLPDLQEVIAAPMYFGGKILVQCSADTLQIYNAPNGRHELGIPLGSKAIGGFAVYRGIVVVALSGTESATPQLAAFNLSDGKRRWSFELSDGLSLGPLPCKDGFLVGTQNAELIRIDGRNGQRIEGWKLSSVPISAVVHEEVVFVGTQGGAVLSYRMGRGTREWSVSLGSGHPVAQMFLCKSSVIAVAKPDLYRLSTSGKVEARSSSVAFSAVAVTSDSCVYAASDATRILELSGGDLEVKAAYRTDQPIASTVLGEGTAIFFSREGKVWLMQEQP